MTDVADGTAAPAAGTVTQAGEVRSARVESLRAVAALAVLVGHVLGSTYNYNGTQFVGVGRRVLYSGGFGVFIFFALSGYLLYLPFVRSTLGDGHVDIGRYARNRLLRIVPAYYVAIAVLLVVKFGGGTWEQWWRFATFTESFSQHTVGTVDGPVWSVVVELYFYLLLPFLAVGLAFVARRRARGVAVGLVTLGAASTVLRLATLQHASHPSLMWQYSLPSTFLFFVPGMLLALARFHWGSARPRWLRAGADRADVWLLAAVLVWLIAAWRWQEYAMAIAALLMVGSCVLPLRPGRLTRLLGLRPLAAVGVVSYSFYLWHLPIVEEVASWTWASSSFVRILALALPASLAAAAISYASVEAPALRLRRRWSPAAVAEPSR